MNNKTSVSTQISKESIPADKEYARLFPVMAIGASAGGLQALSDLLMHLPADLGMAYIIIQHLSPQVENNMRYNYR